MKLIEENSEKLDLLEKTLIVEERQKQRLAEVSVQNEKEQEIAKSAQLYDENSNSASTASLEQEDRQRKEIVHSMVVNSTPSNAPMVKCMTNIQGNIIITPYNSPPTQLSQYLHLHGPPLSWTSIVICSLTFQNR